DLKRTAVLEGFEIDLGPLAERVAIVVSTPGVLIDHVDELAACDVAQESLRISPARSFGKARLAFNTCVASRNWMAICGHGRSGEQSGALPWAVFYNCLSSAGTHCQEPRDGSPALRYCSTAPRNRNGMRSADIARTRKTGYRPDRAGSRKARKCRGREPELLCSAEVIRRDIRRLRRCRRRLRGSNPETGCRLPAKTRTDPDPRAAPVAGGYGHRHSRKVRAND